MNKLFLKGLIIPLVLVLFLITPLKTSAKQENHQPLIVISPDAADIPDDLIVQIIAENPNAGVINIYEYGDVISPTDFEDEMEEITISPQTSDMILIQNVRTTSAVINANSQAKDEFKFSVAKGEKVTLSFTYSGELKGKVVGTFIEKAQIGAEITIKGEYKKGTEYSGPPEGSEYNTREFRMKFYEEIGRYEQTADKNHYYNGKLEYTEKLYTSGTYNKPTKYASYSIDKKL